MPEGAIAQTPVEPRDAARLLVDRGAEEPPKDRTIADLPDLVGAGDLLVVNDTRVLPARLRLRKPTGGAVEVLLLARGHEGCWQALVRPSRRVPVGTRLADGDGDVLEVGDDLGGGCRSVYLLADEGAVLARGEVPLPPYIHEPLVDPERYQTVYAARPASVAAPTAGLHLTPEVLERCVAAGATLAAIDLEVGLGTFRPITAERVEDHQMHKERYRVPPATWEAAGAADRVIAVGTTTVRALEAAAATGSLEGETDLFIRDGHQFRVVDALLTNFHASRSSLLVLLDAFIGHRWPNLYEEALGTGYRFLSFGDAMFLAPERQ